MALSGVVTGCTTVLIETGGGSRSVPLASRHEIEDWLRTATPPDIAVGLLRLAALAACAYLALGLAVTVLAGLAPHRRLVTAAGRLAPAALQRTILRGAVPGLATGMALVGLTPVAASPANAQPAALRMPMDDPEAHTATMTKLPPATPDAEDTSTSATMTHLDDALDLPDSPPDPSTPPTRPPPPGGDGGRTTTPGTGADGMSTEARTTAPPPELDEPRPDTAPTTTVASPAEPDEPRRGTPTTTATAPPSTNPTEAPPDAEPSTPATGPADTAPSSPASPNPTPATDPADAAPASPASPSPAPEGQPAPGPREAEWIVAPGESFWSIAEEALHDARGTAPTDEDISRYWQHLIEANRDRLAAPENPDLLHVGQVLVLPPPP